MEAVRRRPLPLGATIPTWSVSLAVFRLYGLGQGGPTVLSWAKAQNSPVTGLRWVAWVLSPPLCTTNLHYHWPKTILKKKKKPGRKRGGRNTWQLFWTLMQNQKWPRLLISSDRSSSCSEAANQGGHVSESMARGS